MCKMECFESADFIVVVTQVYQRVATEAQAF